jgi:hypothetical protein
MLFDCTYVNFDDGLRESSPKDPSQQATASRWDRGARQDRSHVGQETIGRMRAGGLEWAWGNGGRCGYLVEVG